MEQARTGIRLPAGIAVAHFDRCARLDSQRLYARLYLLQFGFNEAAGTGRNFDVLVLHLHPRQVARGLDFTGKDPAHHKYTVRQGIEQI